MPSTTSPRGAGARTAGLVLVFALEAALALVDVLTPGVVVFTSVYLIAPLVAALFATPRVVAAVGALSIALALGSGAWNDFLFTTDHLVRCATVTVATVLAVLSARSRVGAIDARAQTEDARRAADSARERLDVMLGTLAEAVTVHDERGKTVYANDAAVRLLGAASIEEVLTANPGDIAARFDMRREDGTPVAVADLPGRRAVLGEPADPTLTRSVNLDTGAEYWLLTKATVVQDEDGRPLAVNIIQDVTAAKETERRQRFLAEAGRMLASSLDCERTLAELAQLAVPTLGDWCTVDLATDEGVLERVAAAGDAQAEQDGPVARGSAIVAPMRSGARTHGVISVGISTSRRDLHADDQAFIEDLALRAGAAVENARLYSEQADTARTLQDSLLPSRLPDLPGFRAAASYRAGGAGSTVGGDFYDLFEVGDGAMVLLGDVTGKGVHAAAMTALVRHTAKTAARFDAHPSAVMRVVDEILRERPLSLVTLVCARLRETAAGVAVELAAGGHPLPLLVDREGAVHSVGLEGLVLGAIEGGRWSDDRFVLAPGETLLFYSDGATDAPGEHERFGERRLARVAAGAGDPQALVARIDAAIDRFQDGREGDDRALLAIRYDGSAAAASYARAATVARTD